MDGIVSTDNVSFLLVFLEGILSFFSPCVIPLLPVYMSYLAGNTNQSTKYGIIIYNRKKVLFHTLFFVFGVSFAFFILGMSFTTLGSFFTNNKLIFIRISGILIILLGLFQLGIFDLSFLQKERKIHINLANKKVNPFIAFLLGFTFSFAWTPCIGPALSSVLIMASGAKTSVVGNLLVFIYAIGFVLPFLFLGLFTTQVLVFLKSKQRLLKLTIKAGGILLIIIGFMTFTGFMNGISGYLNTNNNGQNNSENNAALSSTDTEKEEASSNDKANTQPAIDFTLTDQYGNTHTLSDYKGKVVFLNFWATWCPPCNKELPDIEELYKEYNLNQEDVVFLGVTNPKSDEYPINQDVEKEDIISFLDTKGYSFPTLFDETGKILSDYSISAFPTTFIIDKQGNVLGYVPGMITKDIMKNVINQALQATD
ncbi:MAG: cytochrome c biogenesis protein CcdA [Herbinix sp.]|nr:cytochrome c biogenesis protein CcdA [Herbinix sp.]